MIDALAGELLRAWDVGTLVEPLPSQRGLTLRAAFDVAERLIALREARGEKRVGWKIGFTNRTIWQRYDVHAPIWGTVWERTLAFADAAGHGVLSLAACCQPRLEPEVVFAFRRTPAAGAGLQDLFEALDWMAPGFEIVQSHCDDWRFTAAQTMADSGLHARLLVGPRVALPADAQALRAQLAAAQVALAREGTVVERGQGANVLGSPLDALAHFVAELRACPGAPEIGPGDIVTTGTWTDAWPVRAGERWSARFDAPLGELAVTLA